MCHFTVILTGFYMLLGIVTFIVFIYVLINRLNQKDDFEDRDY